MNYAIILAAGKGERFTASQISSVARLKTAVSVNKMLIKVNEKPLIYYPLMIFNEHPEIAGIVIVASSTNRADLEKICKKYHFKKIKKIMLGGPDRHSSFAKGFKALSAIISDTTKAKSNIIVHNGANPLVTIEEISNCIRATERHGAAIVGHQLNSTIKAVKNGKVTKTHEREKLFAAETPQAAQFHIFNSAIKYAKTHNPPKHTGVIRNHVAKTTDEAMLLEAIGQKVTCLPASENNFKITTITDLKRLRSILEDHPDSYRVGLGQDSHFFPEALHLQSASPAASAHDTPSLPSHPCLTLAGLAFPDHPKLEANSDGDVIIHAIFNAISQAIGQKSLGFYADPAFEKGITDSKKYLAIIFQKMTKKGFKLNTLGLMIECKTPKIDPISSKIKRSLSEMLKLPVKKIGITATSGEKTLFGQGLGIQCFAIVSLIKH